MQPACGRNRETGGGDDHLVDPAPRCTERIAEYRAAGVDLPLQLPGLDDYHAVADVLGG